MGTMVTTSFEKMEQTGWTKSKIDTAYADRFSNATKLIAEELSVLGGLPLSVAHL